MLASRNAIILLVTLFLGTSISSGAEIYATGAGQPIGEHWNQATWTGGQWSDGLAPSAGNTYRTANVSLRTVEPGSSTFGGDSLRIEAGGMLGLKQAYNNIATVSLILDGGTLSSSTGTTGGNQQLVSGNVEVASNSVVSLSGTDRRRITLQNGAMSGSGNVTINGGTDIEDILQLAASLTSTHTGDWTVNGGRLVVNLDSHIGSLARVTLSNATSYLDIRSAQAIGSLTGSGIVRSGTTGSFTLTTGGDNTDTLFSGKIENGSATAVALAKSGAGMFTLSGANTYTGATTLNTGILRIAHASALGATSGGTTVKGNTTGSGILELTGGISFAAEPITLEARQGATNNVPHIRNVSGNNTWNGPITLTTGGATYRIESAADTLTVAGNISQGNSGTRSLYLQGDGDGILSGNYLGTGSSDTGTTLTKLGQGTWTLTGDNTYKGLTTVAAGTLLVNNTAGSGTGTGNVIVNADAVLGGTGTIAGAVTVNLDGHIAPGTSPGTLAAGNLSLLAGSFFDVDLTPTAWDSLDVTGGVSLTDAILNLSIVGDFASYGGTEYVLIDNDGYTDLVTGTFDSLPGDSVLNSLQGQFVLSYTGGDGNDVTLTAVPEPITMGLFALAGAGLGGYLRRRRR